mmetsp:Transcript_50517/g.141433  ORF Transcript_50517/g.141433 Transcript_50517/m.141433 type:complete len:109 (+) Transcript_50517:2226-2552(+)
MRSSSIQAMRATAKVAGAIDAVAPWASLSERVAWGSTWSYAHRGVVDSFCCVIFVHACRFAHLSTPCRGTVALARWHEVNEAVAWRCEYLQRDASSLGHTLVHLSMAR